MKTYNAANGWQYWYDSSPGQRVWYAAKFDAEGNQISYSINAYSKADIISMAKD